MSVINYTAKELDLLARLMRAEAIGEGDYGMLMVGNVGVNRVLTDCLDFKNIRTINDMVFQNPGGFAGINSPLFYSSATTKEKQLAERVLKGEYGSMHQVVIHLALSFGTINGFQGNTKTTVFMNHIQVFVFPYIKITNK